MSELEKTEQAEDTVEGIIDEEIKKRKSKSGLRHWVIDIAIALVIAFAILAFFSPTVVRQNSMENTLHDGDYIVISKRAYNFGEVEHGQIVIFETDELDEKGNAKKLIKRAIALPGDTLEITDGKVYLNDEELVEPYIRDDYTTGEIEKITVPENKMFVMGDNRTYSHDSREQDIGFVDMDKLKGRAIFRMYPLGDIGLIK